MEATDGSDLTIGAADPAAGSIATDRAIIMASIVRNKRIAAFFQLPAHIVSSDIIVKLACQLTMKQVYVVDLAQLRAT